MSCALQQTVAICAPCQLSFVRICLFSSQAEVLQAGGYLWGNQGQSQNQIPLVPFQRQTLVSQGMKHSHGLSDARQLLSTCLQMKVSIPKVNSCRKRNSACWRQWPNRVRVMGSNAFTVKLLSDWGVDTSIWFHGCQCLDHESDKARKACKLKGRRSINLACGQWAMENSDIKFTEYHIGFGRDGCPHKIGKHTRWGNVQRLCCEMLQCVNDCRDKMVLRAQQAWSFWGALPYSLLELGRHLVDPIYCYWRLVEGKSIAIDGRFWLVWVEDYVGIS